MLFIEPFVFQLRFEHVAEARHDADRRAGDRGGGAVEIDLQAFLAGGRVVVADVDVHVVRIVVARFAEPAVGPGVVVHVPFVAERAVKDVDGFGRRGFAASREG